MSERPVLERLDDDADEWAIHGAVYAGEGDGKTFYHVVRSRVGDRGLLLSLARYVVYDDGHGSWGGDPYIMPVEGGALAQALGRVFLGAHGQGLAGAQEGLENRPVLDGTTETASELDDETVPALDDERPEHEWPEHAVECVNCGGEISSPGPETAVHLELGGMDVYRHRGECDGAK